MADFNTNAVKHALYEIVREHGDEVLNDTNKFIALMSDYIPDNDRERRLLKHVLTNGVLATMRREDNQKIAIMKSREYMSGEMFLADSAVEAVLECFTYMMEWNYVPPAPAAAPAAAAAAPAAPAQPASRPGLTSPQRQAFNNGAAPAAAAPKAPAKPAAPISERVFSAKNAAKSRLKGTIRVDDGYTTLDAFTFDGFGWLKTVELPSTLFVIGEFAFSECKRLKNIEIPANVKRIGKGAFQSCTKLSMIKIPSGVTEIEENTFAFCSSLEVVELPSTISSIGSEAFQGCSNLKSLFLTNSVKYIDDDAFKLCTSLTIGCYENSYVHKFCQENGLRCKILKPGVGI